MTSNALLRRGPAPRSGRLESSGCWAGSSGQVHGQGSWSQAPRFRGRGWGSGWWGGSSEGPLQGAGRTPACLSGARTPDTDKPLWLENILQGHFHKELLLSREDVNYSV